MFLNFKMFTILIFTTIIITFTSALEPLQTIELADGEIRDIINKQIKDIPDVENQYVINENLSKAISRYFKGKLSLLPLYKLSLKIDRNPIKIPWTLENDDENLSKAIHIREKINKSKT